MSSKKDRLNNEVQRRRQAAVAATQAAAARKSLSVNVAAVLANNAAAHQEMSSNLRKELADFNNGLRKDTVNLKTGIANAYQAMSAQLAAALEAAEKSRLQAEKNRLKLAAAELLQLRDHNNTRQKTTAEFLNSAINSHHEMSAALRKVLSDHTSELHKDTTELLASFALSHKEMGLFLRKELADYNAGMRKDTVSLLTAIAAAYQAMCAQLTAVLAAAEKNRLQAEKTRLKETDSGILLRRDYLFTLLDWDYGSTAKAGVQATVTDSTEPAPAINAIPTPETPVEPAAPYTPEPYQQEQE